MAVSGGADSAALLAVLSDLAPELGVSLRVLHLNHGLRGAESDADEAFVRAEAARLGLDVDVRRASVGESADGPRNLEEAGRWARHEFFGHLIETGVVDKVATGHHRDDQSETVLFRLLRGAGATGLAGIRPMLEPGIIRPLLDLGRAEIRQELRRRGLEWREDASNRDPVFARNRIRHDTLPRLSAEWNPRLAEALARTAEAAREEEDYWRAEIDGVAAETFTERGGWVEMNVVEVDALHRAVRRRLLRRALEKVRGNLRGLDFGHFERLEDLVLRESGSGAVDLPGARAERSFDRLRIGPIRPTAPRPEAAPVEMRPPDEIAAPDGQTRIRVERLPQPLEIASYTNRYGFVLDADALPQAMCLRSRRAGDRLGDGDKLKKLFQQARVPSWERSGWPVLLAAGAVDEERVVWTRGFGVAPEYQVGPETRQVVGVREVDAAGREIRGIEDWVTSVYRK